MKKFEHGGKVWQGDASSWIDFSSNMNLLGTPEFIYRAIENAHHDIGFYPDVSMQKAKCGLCEFLGVEIENVLPTSGGIGALDIVIGRKNPKRVVCFTPCFVEYERISQVNKIPFVPFSILNDCEVKVDFEKLESTLQKGDMLIVCNPINPIGYAFSKSDIQKMISITKSIGADILIDEAFIEFSGENSAIDSIYDNEHVVIVGSLTKLLCIPGIRIGYIVACEKVISKLLYYQTPWAISCYASRVCESLGDEAAKSFAIKSEEQNNIARKKMEQKLDNIGVKRYVSSANFILLDIESFGKKVSKVQKMLEAKNILVRNCENYIDLNEYHMRIAVRSDDENMMLLECLDKILRGNKMSKVYFIGAGPGDPELLTLKGKRIIDEADLIIYAGSLVPRQVIESCKAEAKVLNSASMNLDEVMDEMISALNDDKLVARVHTGDPSIYGAIREQIDRLKEKSIDFEVVPGVSSFVASAAAIGAEFTLPSVSQTVILTRMAGRTPVPDKENLASLASHRASMAIFLSVGMIDKVVDELLTSYSKTTPVAVVQRATWDDQKVVFGTLADIEQKVIDANITKTAQILVGDFLGNDYELSKLYDKKFTHEYRKGCD